MFPSGVWEGGGIDKSRPASFLSDHPAMLHNIIRGTVPPVYLCQPGHWGELLLHGGGVALNPLQAVHMGVQDLNNRKIPVYTGTGYKFWGQKILGLCFINSNFVCSKKSTLRASAGLLKQVFPLITRRSGESILWPTLVPTERLLSPDATRY